MKFEGAEELNGERKTERAELRNCVAVAEGKKKIERERGKGKRREFQSHKA